MIKILLNPYQNIYRNIIPKKNKQYQDTLAKQYQGSWWGAAIASVRGAAASITPSRLSEEKLSYFENCNYPDFLKGVFDLIQLHNPDIVVISLQEDAKPGSYIHSHILPYEMNTRKYTLLKRARLEGVGATTLKKLSARGLRMSVYVRREIARSIIDHETKKVYMKNYVANTKYQDYVSEINLNKNGANSKLFNVQYYEQESYTPAWSQNKGGIAIYLSIPKSLTGTIDENYVFINCHLPFTSSRLKQPDSPDYISKTEADIIEQNQMLKELYEHFILLKSISTTYNIERKNPNFGFIMGDLNYRINPRLYNAPKDINIINQINLLKQNKGQFVSTYKSYDELINYKKKLFNFKEGINNRGPEFDPTCKLCKPRNLLVDTPHHNGILKADDKTMRRMYIDKDTQKLKCYGSYQIAEHQNRYASWCDRILYDSFDPLYDIVCTNYDSYYTPGIMDQSDHNAVYGIYEIKHKTPTFTSDIFSSQIDDDLLSSKLDDPFVNDSLAFVDNEPQNYDNTNLYDTLTSETFKRLGIE